MTGPSAQPGQAPESASHGSFPVDSELHDFLIEGLRDARCQLISGARRHHPKVTTPLNFIRSSGRADALPQHREQVAAVLRSIITSTELAACAVLGPILASSLELGGFTDLAQIVQDKVQQTAGALNEGNHAPSEA